MPTVEVGDAEVEFPDSMSESEIEQALQKNFPPKPEIIDVPPGSLAKPYFQPSQGGFLTTPVTGPMDLVREPNTIPEGLYNTFAKLTGATLSPLGLGTAAIAPIKPLQPVIAGVLGGVGAKQAGQAAGELSVPQGRTPGQVTEALGDIAQNTLMALAPLAPLAPLAKILPEATKETAKSIIQNEVKNASEISKATEVHGDVRPQQEPTGTLPVQEGEQRVQPQAQAGVQGQAPSELLLTPDQLNPNKPEVPPGPGAQTKGEPPYSPIQQLTDQLNATAPVGVKENINAKEKIADAWSEGKSAWDKSMAKMQAVGSTLRDIARGVRDINDMDRRVGELDYALQKSSAQSKSAGESISEQVPNQAMRDAVGIWIDSGGNEQAIRDAIPNLPETTKPRVRRAVELAANLPQEAKQFAEQLKNYFGRREEEAIGHEIFQQGLEDYYTHIWKNPENMPDSLRAAISNGRVSDYFKYSRQRKIPTIIEGIMQGREPVLDPAKVVPHYNYLLDRAIASREFIRKAADLTASDGRPALLPTGTAIPVQVEGTPQGLIINPKSKGELGMDYRLVDHPALKKWKWAGTDENGNPVLYRSDLAVHPEFYERIARMMDRGRLSPTKVGRALLRASTEVKGFKLGLLSAFHQVHVGSHALFHWTLPFKTEPINWESPDTQFAVEKGHLKLAADPHEIIQFSEGIMGPGLVHKLPMIGPISKAYSEWTFGEYIPQLKLKTFQNAYSRAIAMKNKLGLYKGLSDEQIAGRIGDSVNNAFGELNQLFLNKWGRDPRFQRILRGIFLAPDFGEARLRFAEKALTRFGHEERLALGTMFIGFYLAARIGNWLSHGNPEADDPRNAFRVKAGKEWYSMRSVIGDLQHAYQDFGRFMYVRLNPLYSRTLSDWLFSRDVSGKKLSFTEKAFTRPLQQLVPIQASGLTRDDQKMWESFITAMGIQAQKDRPEQDVKRLAKEWMKSSKDPRIHEAFERQEQEVFGPSAYQKLRFALENGDNKKARSEYNELLKTHTPVQVMKAMNVTRPFTTSRLTDAQFYNSLSPAEKQTFNRAKQDRVKEYQTFLKMLAETNQPQK